MNEGELKQNNEADNRSKRLENILLSLRNCKNDFINEREEYKKIREINTKLELELKEARELEKSHRYHLLASREMIGNLQETVSQLVYLKRNEKKLKDELISRDCIISSMEKDKENLISKQNATILELRKTNENHIEELTAINERKIQQVLNECDTRVAQFSCVIEELRSKIKDMETEHRDKLNVVVLDYEEKIQRETAQKSQLQDQLSMHAANIEAYKRKLQELEDKLKQTQFKQYLAQGSYRSQYETQNERPYSATVTDDYRSTDLDPELDRPVPETPHVNVTKKFQIAKTPCTYYNKELNFDKGSNYSAYNNPNPYFHKNKVDNSNNNKGSNFNTDKEPNFNDAKGPNFNYNNESNLNNNKSSNLNENKNLKQSTLQVMYYDKPNTGPKNKKGTFNITKKRKLFNEKDFQDF